MNLRRLNSRGWRITGISLLALIIIIIILFASPILGGAPGSRISETTPSVWGHFGTLSGIYSESS